jgi:hypothetical protein
MSSSPPRSLVCDGQTSPHRPRLVVSRSTCPPISPPPPDDDVFYLFLQKQKIGAELHIYLEEGTYHKRLFRGPNTNDMKK